LTHHPKQRDELKLLFSMGWETANIHLGSGKASQIRSDLQRKPDRWLYKAAKIMEQQVREDWDEWR